MTDAAPTGLTPEDGVDDQETTMSSEEDMPELADIGRDYELLNNRIITRIGQHHNEDGELVGGTEPVTVADLIQLMRTQSEFAQLLMDHIGHTKSLEEHAGWASEQIDNLSAAAGDDDTASQLDKADAAKYQTFFTEIIPLLDERIGAENESAPLEQLKALREEADELKALTDEITLNDEEEPSNAAAAPTPEA